MMEETNVDEIMDKVTATVESIIKSTGKIPTSREWDKMKYYPTRATIRKYTNMTFSKFIKMLGYDIKMHCRKDYTKAEVIDSLIHFYEENRKSPNIEDFKNQEYEYMPSTYALYKYFDSLNEALKEAHIPILTKGFSTEYVLGLLDKFIKKYNRLPVKKDCTGIDRNKELPEYKAFNKFGGIKEAFLQLNYPKEQQERLLGTISLDEYKQQIIEQIDRHINKFGKVPGSKEWDEMGYMPSRKSMEKKMGMNYNEILKSLNFKPENKSPIHYSNEELIYFLKEEALRKGSTPTFEEIKNIKGCPHPKAFIEHFGSYENAVKLAGLESNKFYDKEFLKSEIFRFIKTYGVVPAANALRATEGYPSTKAYKRIWGSFTNCIIELGLEPVCFQIKNAYSKRILSLDKHICYSQEESVVDNYLYNKNILHDKEIYYPYDEKYNINIMKRCDFFVKLNYKKCVYIEYAGLIQKKGYFNKLQDKIKLCDKQHLNLIVIYPQQLGQLDNVILKSLKQMKQSDFSLIVS